MMNPAIEDLLKEKFYHEDGEIKRISARGLTKAGEPIGSVNPNGYVYITSSLNGRSFAIKRAHVVWFFVHGTWPIELDHKDRNRQNDRIDNLLHVTFLENNQNKGLYKTNTSGVVGLSFDKEKKKWRAREKNSRRHLGYFSSKEEALEAIQNA